MSYDDINVEKLKHDGWGNCPVTKCGYFYKQRVIEECPVCRHPWRSRVGYTQPPYEPPSLA